MIKQIVRRVVINSKGIIYGLLPKNPVILPIPPFVSQFHRDKYWDERACAIACLQMVLGLDAKKKYSTKKLIQEGLTFGGYDIDRDYGWYHHSLVNLARKHNLKAYPKKHVSLEEIKHYLSKGFYTSASLSSNKGGHLILIYGFESNRFYYHDPYDKNKKGVSQIISFKNFEKRFKNQIMIFKN